MALLCFSNYARTNIIQYFATTLIQSLDIYMNCPHNEFGREMTVGKILRKYTWEKLPKAGTQEVPFCREFPTFGGQVGVVFLGHYNKGAGCMRYQVGLGLYKLDTGSIR